MIADVTQPMPVSIIFLIKIILAVQPPAPVRPEEDVRAASVMRSITPILPASMAVLLVNTAPLRIPVLITVGAQARMGHAILLVYTQT